MRKLFTEDVPIDAHFENLGVRDYPDISDSSRGLSSRFSKHDHSLYEEALKTGISPL